MHKNSNLKSKLLEGDILISERVLFNDKLRKKRKIINVINSRTDFNTRWPNKTVIYKTVFLKIIFYKTHKFIDSV